MTTIAEQDERVRNEAKTLITDALERAGIKLRSEITSIVVPENMASQRPCTITVDVEPPWERAKAIAWDAVKDIQKPHGLVIVIVPAVRDDDDGPSGLRPPYGH